MRTALQDLRLDRLYVVHAGARTFPLGDRVRAVALRDLLRTDLERPNKFKMPLLMNVDGAAKAALRGIDRGQAVVAFPRQLANAMSLAEGLPDRLWCTIASKVKM